MAFSKPLLYIGAGVAAWGPDDKHDRDNINIGWDYCYSDYPAYTHQDSQIFNWERLPLQMG